jgi:hypothetical protein
MYCAFSKQWRSPLIAIMDFALVAIAKNKPKFYIFSFHNFLSFHLAFPGSLPASVHHQTRSWTAVDKLQLPLTGLAIGF